MAKTNNITAANPDLNKTIAALEKENTCLKNKCEQYEKLIQSFKATQDEAVSLLNKATLEYNARLDYMLDCAKHMYLSMQFAAEASKKN